jgi:photosystem II stability/assembly factor-like uncharacterized protein
MVLDTDVFVDQHLIRRIPTTSGSRPAGGSTTPLDRGRKWTRYKDGFENRRIHTIVRHPLDDDIVFAGSVAGLYVTLNRGESWALISPDTFVVNAITMHPQRPERIVLGTEADGVYVSEDAGKIWRRSSRGLHNVRVASVIPDPEIEGQVYATVTFGGSASGLYVSSDGGANWSRLNQTPIPEILALCGSQGGESPRFVAGTERGFFHSADGVTWERADPCHHSGPRRPDSSSTARSGCSQAPALGVFTSKDGGRKWYRLGLEDRTIDIALGWIKSGPALYALTSGGPEGVRRILVDPESRALPVTGDDACGAARVGARSRRRGGREGNPVRVGRRGSASGTPPRALVGGEGATAFTPLHSTGIARRELQRPARDPSPRRGIGLVETGRDSDDSARRLGHGRRSVPKGAVLPGDPRSGSSDLGWERRAFNRDESGGACDSRGKPALTVLRISLAFLPAHDVAGDEKPEALISECPFRLDRGEDVDFGIAPLVHESARRLGLP